MTLIIIYGPPAVGKLSVAKELSNLTGYKLLHNHTTLDMLFPIFDDIGSVFRLSNSFRMRILKEALSKRIGLIMTFCYAYHHDDKMVKDIIRYAKIYRTKVDFVQIICKKEILIRRVKGKSRQGYLKIKDPNKLKSAMEGYELFRKIPFVKSLSIENSRLSPSSAAGKIMDYLKR